MKPVQRNRGHWLRLTLWTFTTLLGVLSGVILPTSYLYTHYLTHPGCAEAGLTPASVGIENAQEVSYPSHDGLTLRAWYLPPQNGAVIILLPGGGGAREGMLREGAILARHGYGLLLTELRSCAHPKGESSLGYREAADLTEAVTWVLAQPGVAHVGVLGFSLGGVTGILGAASDPRIEAVVAEGGFYDLKADILNDGNGPWWAVPFYHAILFFFRLEAGVNAGEISPISVIDRISPRPLFLIYGDRETATTHPWRLLGRAREPKELWIVPGCGHGAYLDVAAEEWERRVVAFFEEALLQHHMETH